MLKVKLFYIVIVFLITTTALNAKDLTFEWEPIPPVDGYRLYWGPQSRKEYINPRYVVVKYKTLTDEYCNEDAT